MPATLALPICESCGHAAPDIYRHRLYQPGLCKSPPLEIDVCGNCMNLVKGGIISRKSVIGMIKARSLSSLVSLPAFGHLARGALKQNRNLGIDTNG